MLYTDSYIYKKTRLTVQSRGFVLVRAFARRRDVCHRREGKKEARGRSSAQHYFLLRTKRKRDYELNRHGDW